MDINSLIIGLEDVADLINSGSDTEATLHQLIVAACRNGGWLRGSIMSIDLASGYGYVTVRYDPTLQLGRPEDSWVLATSPSLVALRGNQPVFIPDAKASEEFPGFRKESQERGYSSVLVMPMLGTDLLGRPMVLTVNSERVKDLGPTDLALMKLIVHLGSIAVEKQKAFTEQRNSARAREMVLATHTRLMQQAISDGSVQKLCETIYPIIMRPALVVDLTTNTILPGGRPAPELMKDEEWLDIVESQLRSRIHRLPFETMREEGSTLVEFHISLRHTGLDLIANVYPLRIDGEVVGALILFGEDELSEYDQLLIGSARLAISVQLMRNMIRFQSERRTLDDLFAEIIEGRWRTGKDLAQRALKYGIRLDRAYRMIVVAFRERDDMAAAALANIQQGMALIFEKNDTSPIIIGHSHCIVVLVPAWKTASATSFQAMMRKILEETRHYTATEPTLVLSAPCQALPDYQQQWNSCKTILDIAQSFERTGILHSENLGPIPMLVATADLEWVASFVRGSVGAIIEHDRRNETQFLATLNAYIEAGYRNQQCADTLSIHVTTLRYRLAKISETFNLDLETPARRFEIELAIRMSKLVHEDP